MRQHDGILAADDFVEGDELLGADERASAVVDEDVADIVGQLGERRCDGILALGATADEDRRRGRIGRELDHLLLVAVGDDEEIHGTAADEGCCGVREDRFSGERGEHLVRHGAGHSAAAAGGEEDGGGAGHGAGSESESGGGVW